MNGQGRLLGSVAHSASAAVLSVALLSAALLVSGLPVPVWSSDRPRLPVDTAAASALASKAPTRRVVVIGDSNSAAAFKDYGYGDPWPYRLIKLLSADASHTYFLDNHAVSRKSSGYFASRTPSYLADGAEVVIVMIGTNDVTGGGPAAKPNCSAAQTTSNIRKIVKAAKAARSKRNAYGHPLVILMQPPPAVSRQVRFSGQTSLGGWRPLDHRECPYNSLKTLADVCTKIAAEQRIPLVRTWSNMRDLGYDGSQADRALQETYLIDGLHVKEPVQSRIAEWAKTAIFSRKF